MASAPIDVTLTCQCESVAFRLAQVQPSTGAHLRCHCRDCRAFLRVMDPTAKPVMGVHIFQTSPSRLHLMAGGDHMACLTLSPRALYRWYASCCQTPMFNTLRSVKLPFVGVLTECADHPKAFGPVVAEGFIPDRKTGGHKTTGSWTMVSRLARRMVGDRVSGRWKETPFFDVPTGAPVVEPRLITKDERAAAYA